MQDSLHEWTWDGSGPRVTALHGWGGCGLDFESLALASPNPWRALDLRGHGLSRPVVDADEHAVEAQRHDLGRALVKEDFLLGYSMGGRLALQWATAADMLPRGLILVGAHPGIPTGPEKETRRRWDHEQASALEAIGARRHMLQWQDQPLIATQRERMEPRAHQHMVNRRQESHSRSLAASLRGFGSGTMPDCWDLLEGITCPVLLVTGAQDERYTDLAAEMCAKLPTGDLLTVPDAGHAAHLENPAAFLDGLQHWMGGR